MRPFCGKKKSYNRNSENQMFNMVRYSRVIKVQIINVQWRSETFYIFYNIMSRTMHSSFSVKKCRCIIYYYYYFIKNLCVSVRSGKKDNNYINSTRWKDHRVRQNLSKYVPIWFMQIHIIALCFAVQSGNLNLYQRPND